MSKSIKETFMHPSKIVAFLTAVKNATIFADAYAKKEPQN
jgi:hypothetical protein